MLQALGIFLFHLSYILLSLSNNSFSKASEFIAAGGKGLNKNHKQERTGPVTLKAPVASPLQVHLPTSKDEPTYIFTPALKAQIL